MARASLQRLLRPRSIAVFGGSWAHSVVEQCTKMGFTGEVWPVHPTRESICGVPCFKSIDALPYPPDASFVGVNRNATIEVVQQLASAGAGGAVCFASGFSEASEEDVTGVELQHALLNAAGDMPIFGPNCYGFINYLDGALLWPDQHGGKRVDSGVAILTQSSNMAINLTMQTRGLPVAYVLTAGNQAQVSLAQQARALVDDERVTALGLHIEGFGDIREFEEFACYAHARGKPVIAIKVGRSDAARAALVSHTSSLSGSDAAADAFLARLGIPRVQSLTVFVETLKLLHVRGSNVGRRILSMSCSGGEACLVSDAVGQFGIECPPLNSRQQQALRAALGERVALANPLDYHTYIWNEQEAMYATFHGMLQGDADVAFLVLDFPRGDRCEYPSWDVAINAYRQASAHWQGTVAVVATLPENMPEDVAASMIADGMVPLCGLEDALAAISLAASFAASFADNASAATYSPVFLPQLDAMPDARGEVDLRDAATSEAKTKQWLASFGVPVPASVVLDPDACAGDVLAVSETTMARLGVPVAVKAQGMAHKSDAGGVVLGVRDASSLADALHTIDTGGGALIEAQFEGAIVELLVGVVRDPVHGFVLSVGAGGVQTELHADVSSALLPLTETDVRHMLENLRCYPLLQGYRGKPGVQFPSLLDSIMAIQRAALNSTVPDAAVCIEEIEINPLMCSDTGCMAADALLRTNTMDSPGL